MFNYKIRQNKKIDFSILQTLTPPLTQSRKKEDELKETVTDVQHSPILVCCRPGAGWETFRVLSRLNQIPIPVRGSSLPLKLQEPSIKTPTNGSEEEGNHGSRGGTLEGILLGVGLLWLL